MRHWCAPVLGGAVGDHSHRSPKKIARSAVAQRREMQWFLGGAKKLKDTSLILIIDWSLIDHWCQSLKWSSHVVLHFATFIILSPGFSTAENPPCSYGKPFHPIHGNPGHPVTAQVATRNCRWQTALWRPLRPAANVCSHVARWGHEPKISERTTVRDNIWANSPRKSDN